MDEATITCGSCGESAPEGATWCEACGHELGIEPKPACVSCGEREVDTDEGYCLSCGYRQPRERDHLVVADGPVVAISDRGRRHHRNEDAVAVGRVVSAGSVASAGGAEPETEAVILVVCDGVSSTPGSARASAAAAGAAKDELEAGLSATSDGGEVDVAELLVGAVAAAQAMASASLHPGTGPGSDGANEVGASADGPPSSTLVAVVVRPVGDLTELSAAWVGDSRAYWVGEGTATLLTGPDHEFEGSLTRWLGSDSVDPTPDIETTTIAGAGHLVVCSDGLWRYVDEPGELIDLFERLLGQGRTGIGLAEAVVDHANQQGGHDNITVALWSNRADWPTDANAKPTVASAMAADADERSTR